MKTCPQCGAQNHDSAVYCQNCHNPLPPGPIPPAYQNQTTGRTNQGGYGQSSYAPPQQTMQSTTSTAGSMGAAGSMAAAGMAAGTANARFPSNAGRHMREEELPPHLRLMHGWGYVGYDILFAIPVIGFILLIVFAVSDKNMNRRYYARSYFCKMLLVLIILTVIIVIALATGSFAALSEKISEASRSLR